MPVENRQSGDMVSEAAMNDIGVQRADATSRASVLRRLRTSDLVFHMLTRGAAMAVLLLLGGVIAALVIGAAPALSTYGFSFFVSESWNPVTEKFGALAPVYGTLVTSFIAMLIAVPIGLMVAFFLTELCPMALRRPIGIAIELLAGIPSIIYGIWGLFIFAPFLQQHVQPFLIDTFGNIPLLAPEAKRSSLRPARLSADRPTFEPIPAARSGIGPRIVRQQQQRRHQIRRPLFQPTHAPKPAPGIHSRP